MDKKIIKFSEYDDTSSNDNVSLNIRDILISEEFFNKKNEILNNVVYEKATEKQILARKRFIEMINKKKKKTNSDTAVKKNNTSKNNKK